MPDYTASETNAVDPSDPQIRIKFNDKATRRAFMLKAAQASSFPFRFENYDSVLVKQSQAVKLQSLAREFGAELDHVVNEDHSRLKERLPAPTHEDRVASWNKLMTKIDQELSSGPA